MATTEHIIELERQLLQVVQSHDITILNSLLHEDLLFNGPDGQTYTKEMDIEMHKSGSMIVKSIAATSQTINRIDDATYVIATTIETVGSIGDFVMDGTYRYLRVWKAFGESWKIIAGSCVAL